MIMPPFFETGHAKNIANFEDLISFCQGYGANYNPTKESLKILNLQDLHQKAQDKLNNVKTQKTAFDYATNERMTAFKSLKPLATKVINAFAVSGADVLAIADAKTVNKKLQGGSSKKKLQKIQTQKMHHPQTAFQPLNNPTTA